MVNKTVFEFSSLSHHFRNLLNRTCKLSNGRTDLQKERNLGVLRQCFIAPPPAPNLLFLQVCGRIQMCVMKSIFFLVYFTVWAWWCCKNCKSKSFSAKHYYFPKKKNSLRWQNTLKLA